MLKTSPRLEIIVHFFKKNKLLTVVILQLICTIAFTFPTIFHLSDMIIGDGGDNYEYFSYQYLVHQNLSQGKLPFSHTTTFFYPNGFNLSLVDGQLLNLVGGFLNFLLPAVLTFNLVTLLAFFCNGFTSYLFFSKLSKSKKLGLLASVIYGYAYQRLSYGSNFLNLLPIYGFMLGAFYLISIFRDKDYRWSNFILLFSSFFIIALSSLQYVLVLVLCLVTSFIFALLFFKKSLLLTLRNKTVLIRVFACGCSLVLLFSIWFRDSLNLFITHQYPPRGIEQVSLKPAAYFLPNPYAPTILSDVINRLEKHGFILPERENLSVDKNVFWGFVEICLIVSYFLLVKKNKTDYFMLSGFAVFFCLSLGQLRGYPNWYLYQIYPFKGIYETYRLFTIYYIFLTYFSLMGMKAVLERLPSKLKQPFFLAIILLVFLERISSNYYLSSSLNDPYHSFIQTLDSQAIFYIPLETSVATSNNLFPILDHKSILDGYTHWSAETTQRRSFINFDNQLSRFYCDFRQDFISLGNMDIDLLDHQKLNEELSKRLIDQKINFIVVNKYAYSYPDCLDARIAANTLFEDQLTSDSLTVFPDKTDLLKKVYEDDQAIIYQITRED